MLLIILNQLCNSDILGGTSFNKPFLNNPLTDHVFYENIFINKLID